MPRTPRSSTPGGKQPRHDGPFAPRGKPPVRADSRRPYPAPTDPTGELYVLDDDPGEIVNRWADPAYAGMRRDLTDLLVYLAPATSLHLPLVGFA